MAVSKFKEFLMRKWFVSLSLACAGSIALANVASAQIQIQAQAQPVQIKAAQVQQIEILIQPGEVQLVRAAIAPGIAYVGGNRLAQADAVFVGRVIALEPMDVTAATAPNGPKVNYRVAIVQITESIYGLKKDTKSVRIGFTMQPIGNPRFNGGRLQIQPAIQPGGRRPFPGNFQQQVNLQVGQDGLFSVNKHHKEEFYLSPNVQNFVTRENNPNFETQLKTAKQLSKVMVDPVASLKSDDKQDRYTAAAVLINKYRTPNNPTGQPMKLEPIDAAESKLVLQALAAGEWKQGVFNAAIPTPFELFNQLGVTAKDGYSPVNIRTQPELFTAMQKWLDENNGKYRIQKYVVDPNAKVQPGISDPKPGIRPGIRPGVRPLPPIRIQPGNVQPLPGPPPIELDLPAQPAQPLRRDK